MCTISIGCIPMLANRASWLVVPLAGGSRHDEEEEAAGGDDQPSGAGCLGEVVGGDACGKAACDGDADG